MVVNRNPNGQYVLLIHRLRVQELFVDPERCLIQHGDGWLSFDPKYISYTP